MPGHPPDALTELLAFAGGFVLALIAVCAIVWRARREARRDGPGPSGDD